MNQWPAPIELDENGLPVLRGYISEAGHALAADSAAAATDAHTVDGFHASATATANTLLALNTASKLPASITGDAATAGGLAPAVSGANAHLLATGASGQAQIDGILTLLSTLTFSDASSGVRIKFIPMKQITAGSPQSMFTVTTPSTAGQTGGHYGCMVVTHAGRGGATASATAGMLNISLFERAMREDSTGVTSTILELAQTASAATQPASRDITDIALTVDETNELVCAVQINVTRSGTNTQEPYVSCWVFLTWGYFLTAPVVAAV